MDRFNNKYRIASARAGWWNYQWPGAYFITICTKDRQCFFGEIKNKKMILSDVGVIADLFWHEITKHSKNVELGAFVVMPNHVHGILILKNEIDRDGAMVGDGESDYGGSTDCDVSSVMVETLHATSLPPPPPLLKPPPPKSPSPQQQRDESFPQDSQSSKNQFMSRISPKPNSVSTIIRSYKSVVARHANRLGLTFAWQERFHDHIIRDDTEYQRINDYIENNPRNWDEDKFNM